MTARKLKKYKGLHVPASKGQYTTYNDHAGFISNLNNHYKSASPRVRKYRKNFDIKINCKKDK